MSSLSARSSWACSRTSPVRLSVTRRPTGPLACSTTGNCTTVQWRGTVRRMHTITIIGAGVAGLTAAITCAEQGAEVRLLEAHETLGGRARSTDGSYKANLGPHATYRGGTLWNWLHQRDLMPPVARPQLTGYRFHCRVGGRLPRPHGACWPDWLWLPPAAASNRACGSPVHGTPTSFTDGHTQSWV